MRLLHKTFLKESLHGRYLPPDTFNKMLVSWRDNDLLHLDVIGRSVEDRELYRIKVGQGNKKVLMWSQMHGNESTTTKAVADLVEFLISPHDRAQAIRANCTITILPQLNPDGAQVYTRVNANDVDLNRDAVNRSQPESKVLRGVYDRFQPDYCLNLHDQRTIFNVGNSRMPATLSFLSPAADEERSITDSRAESMRLIAGMNRKLQELIPGQVGRYDDTFNINCVGDTFQSLGTPTILFEAGHYPNDYQREKSRELVWYALVEVLSQISGSRLPDLRVSDYLEIPENSKLFYDILLRNADNFKEGLEEGSSAGVLYKEVLSEGAVQFEPYLADLGLLDGKYGHLEVDCASPEGREWLVSNPEIRALF